MVYGTALDLRVLPPLGFMPLRSITPAEVESWLATLRRKKVGAPSILKAATVLQAIMTRAVINGLIDSNPVRAVRKPPQRATRQPLPIAPLTVERMRAMLELRDATMISVLAYAGLRPESELLPLRWRDVGEQMLEIRATKTGTVRHVRLLEPLAEDLRTWREQVGGSAHLVFPLPEGGEWDATDWQNWRRRVWRPAAKAAGLVDSRPRDLRASYASLLIATGLSVVAVAREMGHSPEMCLRSYARAFAEYDPAGRRSAVEQIADARKDVHKGPVRGQAPTDPRKRGRQ
jgi:integrase